LDIDCEIKELRSVKETLKAAAETAKQDLHNASIIHRIAENRKAQDHHLAMVRRAEDLFSQYKAVIGEIEGLQGHRNALEQLIRITADMNGHSLADFDFDLHAVLSKFNQATLSFDFELSRIQNINISLQNLVLQLDAVHKGRRGYHQLQAKIVPQKIHTVNPLPPLAFP